MIVNNQIARRLDGTIVAAKIRDGLRTRIDKFRETTGRQPKLGILLAGNDPGSEIYVRNKMKNSAELGIETELKRLPDTALFSQALKIVQDFNANSSCDGILVQSPLPVGMGVDAGELLFSSIDPKKDVDGFNPVNVGRLVQNRQTLFPCTPSGIIELLNCEGIKIAGARAVVIGRSDIVGKPMAMLLLHRHATVTVCHSKTVDLKKIASSADLLVAAIGRAAFVTREFVKPGSIVIDVGMNRLDNREQVENLFGPDSKKLESFDKRGSVVTGDVHPEVIDVAGALTPVPGGVGPLTIAMLLSNTVSAAEQRILNSQDKERS